MKQYAVIGASSFGQRILEELILLDCEIVLIDKDPEIIEYFKNEVTAAYIANVINKEIVTKLIPADIDAVVVDLGDKIEASILVTQYLSKIGVPRIIVKAETDQHGEILSLVGAHHVVFPNIEAAKRLTPLLISDLMFNYMTISGGLVFAEIGIPEDLINHTLLEMNIRQQGINVVASRRGGDESFHLPDPNYRFQSNDILLVNGREEDVLLFAGDSSPKPHRGVSALFSWFFGGRQPV